MDNKVTCHKLNMFTVGVAVLSYFFCGRLWFLRLIVKRFKPFIMPLQYSHSTVTGSCSQHMRIWFWSCCTSACLCLKGCISDRNLLLSFNGGWPQWPGSSRLISRIRRRFLNSKKDTRQCWKEPEKNMRRFRQVIITKTGITYFSEWRNIYRTICCSCMIPGCLPRITKPKGFWGIINGNRRRPWHSEVSKASITSVNAWACLFWCAEKSRQIYLTEYPGYLDKEDRWF